MKIITKAIAISLTCFCLFSFANSEEIITFTPPTGWKAADLKDLSPVIKTMLVGTSNENFPPSITLAIEPFNGSLKDYLKIVKNVNKAQNTEWKNLGKIKTNAGDASLSQFDEKSAYGTVRNMTAILVKDGNVYIMSAAALKSEFSNFYKNFFEAIRSLNFSENS